MKDSEKQEVARKIVTRWNKFRLSNKGKWVFLDLSIWGVNVKIKSFDTWIQFAEFNCGLRTGSPMYRKVSEIKKWLNDTVIEYVNHYHTV